MKQHLGMNADNFPTNSTTILETNAPNYHRSKVIELMKELRICAPESMVEHLSDKKVRQLVIDKSELQGGFFFVDKSVFESFSIHQGEKKSDNKLVFLRNSNDLEFIFNYYQICSGELLPVLISPLTTDSEITELKDRFKPGSFLDGGKFISFDEAEKVENIYKDDAVIILTSGSSGKPKAVVHSFTSLINASLRGNSELGVTKGDKWLLSLPIHHISGFSILFRSIVASSELILVESLNPTDAKFANSLKFNPTLVSFVPSQLKDYLETENSNSSSFRHILLGGSAVDPQLITHALEKKLNISKVYGSSETAAFIAITDHESLIKDIDAGARPLEGVTISTEKNELLIETDQLFNRYFDDETLTTETKNGDKFRTGDLVEIDSGGEFRITGRKSRFIISGGLNVDPAEVERVIRTFPGIDEVFVFSVINEKWGEAVSALLKTGVEIDFQDFHSYLKSHLMLYKIPKYYRIVDDIPKTAIGKYDLESSRRLLFER